MFASLIQTFGRLGIPSGVALNARWYYMPAEEVQRRLAAILSADVVGYSRLMEADEEATIRALSSCRRVVDELRFRTH